MVQKGVRDMSDRETAFRNKISIAACVALAVVMVSAADLYTGFRERTEVNVAEGTTLQHSGFMLQSGESVVNKTGKGTWLLPDFSLSIFAVAIPLAECVIGSFLVFSRWVRLSAAAVSAMLVVFIIALFQTALRGLDVSCGCFGGTSSSGPLPAILRDLILLVPSLWLAVRPRDGKNMV